MPPTSLSTRLTMACVCLTAWGLAVPAAEEEALKADGQFVAGKIRYAGGAWSVGESKLAARDVVVLHFTEFPPPERIPTGVFVRGGTLIAGTLDSFIGDDATVNTSSLSVQIKIKKEELAGAFFSLPTGAKENFSALARYGLLLASLAESPGDGETNGGAAGTRIFPGRRDRVTYQNLDGIDGQAIRLGTDKVWVNKPGGKLDTPNRDVVRLIERKVEPLAPGKDTGPELFVRLKAGDVIRGRIQKLDDKSMTLATSFAGNLELPRETLAAAYSSGAPGGGLRWLSAQVPTLSKHTPVFDADFPAKANLSCSGRLMQMAGRVCDRGVGVHSKSDLAYKIEGKPGQKFFALAGLDDGAAGKGQAEAKVFVDGKEAWKVVLKHGAAPVPVSVDLGAAKELKLVVEYGPDQDDGGDHVNWGWAALMEK